MSCPHCRHEGAAIPRWVLVRPDHDGGIVVAHVQFDTEAEVFAIVGGQELAQCGSVGGAVGAVGLDQIAVGHCPVLQVHNGVFQRDVAVAFTDRAAFLFIAVQ